MSLAISIQHTPLTAMQFLKCPLNITVTFSRQSSDWQHWNNLSKTKYIEKLRTCLQTLCAVGTSTSKARISFGAQPADPSTSDIFATFDMNRNKSILTNVQVRLVRLWASVNTNPPPPSKLAPKLRESVWTNISQTVVQGPLPICNLSSLVLSYIIEPSLQLTLKPW